MSNAWGQRQRATRSTTLAQSSRPRRSTRFHASQNFTKPVVVTYARHQRFKMDRIKRESSGQPLRIRRPRRPALSQNGPGYLRCPTRVEQRCRCKEYPHHAPEHCSVYCNRPACGTKPGHRAMFCKGNYRNCNAEGHLTWQCKYKTCPCGAHHFGQEHPNQEKCVRFGEWGSKLRNHTTPLPTQRRAKPNDRAFYDRR